MRVQNLVRKAARILTGYTFVTLGYDALRAPGKRVDTAAPLLAKARQVVPLPVDDEALVKVNGLTQAGAGAMLAAGVLPRLSAFAIFSSLVPTTLAGHAYWNIDDPEQRAAQRVQFRKNMALLGGLLFCMLDSKRRR